jgi:hypothetical protein
MFSRSILATLLALSLLAPICLPVQAQTSNRGAPAAPVAQRPAVPALVSAQKIVSTTLEASNVLGVYGAPIILKAKLISSDATQSVDYKNITFKVDGAVVKNVQTDNSGIAHHSFTLLPDYAVGLHKIEAIFEGSAPLAQAHASATLSAMKATTTLDASVYESMSNTPGSSDRKLSVIGKLLRATDKAPLVGRAILATVNGAQFATGATQADGTFRIEETFNKNPGTYKVQATFEDDSHYLGTSSTAKDIVLAKPPTTVVFLTDPALQPPSPIYIVGQPLTISTKATMLSGGYGPALAGVNVWFRSSGNAPVEKAITNAGGNASAKFRVENSGENIFAAEVNDGNFIDGLNPNGGYKSSHSIVQAVAAPLIIQVQGPASAKVGDEVSLKITLSNGAFADAPLDWTAITINGVSTSLKGGVSTLKTIVSGNQGFGNQQVKVKFAGSKNYIASEANWNVNILPKDN